MGIFDGSLANSGGNEMYFNGTSWVPQFTGENGQAMSQADYTQQYGSPIQPRIGLEPTGAFSISNQSQVDTQKTITDLQNSMTNNVSTGYDSYLSQLDKMLTEGLPQQKSSQEAVVNSQYQQGVNDLNTQQSQGLVDLGLQRTQAETGLKKNLRTLGEDVRNQMQAGNVYLGARGAGDSSASKMYAYALGKAANRNKSDQLSNYQNIQSQINNAEFKLKSTVNNEMVRLRSEKDQKVNQIGTWFADAQNQIRQAVAQGKLQKGRDLANISQTILTNAINQMNQIQQNSQAQQDALKQWAMNRSTNLNELKQNLEGITAGVPTVPTTSNFNPSVAISGSTIRNSQPLYIPGNTPTQDKNNIFGGFGGSGLSGGGATGGW